ncbi:hemolysin family protein [Erysipelotrichaceae bacterium OttesenSCG-928-M19]|nr:hemolysin family protein [Erysipelotrichaceae bacterium OttesenSCG-928-M19]
MEFEPGSIQQLIVIIILIFVNAFFAMSEMAIVSVNKNRINTLAEKGNKQAIALNKILEDPNKFLSTIQVGITLAGFLSSAFAASSLSAPLEKIFTNLGIPSGQTIAIIIITLILSYFTLVFGELVPKRIALQKPETIALNSIYIITFVSKISAFFVKILSMSTNFFMRLLKIDTNKVEEQVTEEEINQLLEIGTKHGLLNETGKEMIESVFLFDDKLAKDVMTSRKNVLFIDIDKPFTEYYDEYFDAMFSRVPVYKDDADNVIGILYMKDLLVKAYEVGFDNIDLTEIIQEPYFTSERKNIDVLFTELQNNKKHIAILIDEYGGVSGIVTMEDLVEEIVGEIEDEFDEYDEIVKENEYTYLIKGYVTISDLNDELDLELDDTNEDYDTIAGLLIDSLGDLPDNVENSTVVIDDLVFKPVEIVDNKIELVKLIFKKDDKKEEESKEEEK